MTSKPVTGIRIKDGKVSPKSTYRGKTKALKAARLAKAWKKKSPRRTEG